MLSTKNLTNAPSNGRICCFSFSFMLVNEECSGIGLLLGQIKQFEDVTLGSGK